MVFFIFLIIFIFAIIGLIKQKSHIKDLPQQELQKAQLEIQDLKSKCNNFTDKINVLSSEKELMSTNLAKYQEKLISPEFLDFSEKKHTVDSLNNKIHEYNQLIESLLSEITSLKEKEEKLNKQVHSQTNKINRIKELYFAMDYSLEKYIDYSPDISRLKLSQIDVEEINLLSPSIMLNLHCMNIKDLQKAFRDNDKQISTLLERYLNRYTTKSNRSIYQLMVISLRSELQNILYNLKFEKLDNAIEQVKLMTAKYLKIAGEGNQSIIGSLTKFIGEIEYLFINAVKIEYNYYIKQEQAKQEQLAIREQMKQEAAERKALESERKHIEKEENKYNNELEKLKTQLITANENELQKLNSRILELQSQLADVKIKKNDIINLQNGKAGNIYIVSNLGSFGEDVFKVGMTRRLEPQDRINELGNASVPFKFDVHSFIFSNDAVELEKRLHTILNEKRVNKVNLRKEFFRIPIEELEKIVYEIEPTAAFNKTMVAQEFRQSLSTDQPYTDDYETNFNDDE